MSKGAKYPREMVEPWARRVHEVLRPHHLRVEFGGSLRRGSPQVGDIDLVTCGRAPSFDLERVLRDEFGMTPEPVEPGKPRGPRACFWLPWPEFPPLQVDVWLVPERCFGAAMMYCTGPGMLNTVQRRLFRERTGGRLDLLGVFDAHGRVLARETEEDCYRAIGWDYLEPGERSDWRKVCDPYVEGKR